MYVRNVQTGQVRSVLGPQAYMLQATEELYEKELMPLVEDLLRSAISVYIPSVCQALQDVSWFK